MNKDLLFFTVATGVYRQFVAPYIFFSLYNNLHSFAEILVDDPQKLLGTAEGFAIEKMKTMPIFKDRFIIRSPSVRHRDPHTIRFLEEPITRCKYTYIGDIDVLILEGNIVETHCEEMRKRQTIFSNRIRGKSKLTGLHFVKTEEWYKATKKARADTKHLDEQALYDIVNRSIGNPHKLATDIRPLHGFHLSPNRPPEAPKEVASWKTGPEPLRVIYRNVIKSDEYNLVKEYFDPRFKATLKTLDGILNRG